MRTKSHSPRLYTHTPNPPHHLTTSPIIILLLLPLHTHLPRPQRLRQPARKTGLTTCLTRRRIPPAATASIRARHTDGAISGHRCGKRRWFPAAGNRSLGRRGGGCGFGSHGCSGGGSGATVHAVGHWGRWWHRSDGLWWGWGRRRGFFFQVSRRSPALGGAVELFGEPPACDEMLTLVFC